ncbi:hypothetical protein ACJX0J_021093 [Zea mays]
MDKTLVKTEMTPKEIEPNQPNPWLCYGRLSKLVVTGLIILLEINQNYELNMYKHPNDRPDIIVRVFHMKLQQLLDDLQSGKKSKNEKGCEITTETIDSWISAEIPDPELDPLGYALTTNGYQAHINVEYVNKSTSKGYIQKIQKEEESHVNKEAETIDEIQEYLNRRYINMKISPNNGVGMEKKDNGRKDNMVSKLEGSIIMLLMIIYERIMNAFHTIVSSELGKHFYGMPLKIVLTVASSGVASLLLPNGCTTHSRFRIPIDLDQFDNFSSDSTLIEIPKEFLIETTEDKIQALNTIETQLYKEQ